MKRASPWHRCGMSPKRLNCRRPRVMTRSQANLSGSAATAIRKYAQVQSTLDQHGEPVRLEFTSRILESSK